MLKKIAPHVIAAAIGMLTLLLVEPGGPDHEHWDNPVYWSSVYPAICIGCGVLGYFFPANAWSYGLLVMGVQAFPALIMQPDAELIAVSVAIVACLSVPPALIGLVGALVRRRYAVGGASR